MTVSSVTRRAAPLEVEADRPRDRRAAVFVVASLLLVVWVVAVAVSGARAAGELRAARAAVDDAERVLEEADLVGARSLLIDASADAAAASQRLGGLHVRPLRIVPVVGPNLRAIHALSDAVRDTGSVTAQLLDDVDEALSRDRPAGFAELSITSLAELEPSLRTVATTVQRTVADVDAVGSSSLFGEVARARASYLASAGPAARRAEVGADLAASLPTFLGGDGPRTYLLAAASLSELRGSGGLIGSYSVLHAEDGRLEIDTFHDIEVLEQESTGTDVAPPSDAFGDRYRSLGALRFWRNANLSIDFPATAEILLELWERGDRPPLDGVIQVDPVAFEGIVERSGSIDVPGVTTLTAESTRRFVGLDAYAAFEDNVRRKEVLGAVAAASFERAFSVLQGGDVQPSVELLAELAAGGHLQVYSREPDVQSALARTGVGGVLDDAPGEFTAVVVNNVAGNKVDYFTERSLEHRVELVADGLTRSHIDVVFDNEAPGSGLPRHVLGPWVEDAAPGDNLSHVTLLCGVGCEVSEGPEGALRRGHEQGHPATDVRVHVPAGERRSIGFTTLTPDGWQDRDGRAELVVRHRHQATIAADHVRVVVEVPDGYHADVLPDGAEVVGDEVVWETDGAATSLELRFAFRRAG
jgi:hypothetical protein